MIIKKISLFFLLFITACSGLVGAPASEELVGAVPEDDVLIPITSDEEPEPLPELDDPIPFGLESEFSTDFSNRSVPFSDILSGGPPKDGIPAIDTPKYVSIQEADEWLLDQEPVIALVVDEGARAYPVQILMWHEIVNDQLHGLNVSVTYCPLCNTAIAFERDFMGQTLDFGTTGRLRFSNLIMYDRQTETWWQQATGEGIAGTYNGEQLNFVPVTLLSWKDFKSAHPEADVLSRETGFSRAYGANPYVNYDNPNSRPFLFMGPETPEILPPMTRVLTIDLQQETVAYPYPVLQEVRVANDVVGGQPVVVFWTPETASALDAQSIGAGEDVGAAAAFSRMLNGEELTFVFDNGRIVDEQTGSVWDIFGKAVSGEYEGQQLEPVVSINHFWFSWAAFRPQTRIYEILENGVSAPEFNQEILGSLVVPDQLPGDFEISFYHGGTAFGGEQANLSEVFIDGKPVVINFWAGLCPLCWREMPELEAVYQKYQEEIVVVGVDIGPFVGLGSYQDGKDLVERLGITYPVGSAVDRALMQDFKVFGVPMLVFIQPDGTVYDQWSGVLNQEQIEAFFQELIAASKDL